VEGKLRGAVKAGRLKERSEDVILVEGVRAGIISEDDAEIVRQAKAARQQVIQVDDFPSS
jgi:hypothetical protein